MATLTAKTDSELLALFKQGDQAAFDILYQRYWQRVLALAHQKTGDLMEAENIVQDVFVSLWKRRYSLTLTGDFSNYLFVSVKYRVLKVLAQKKRRYAESLEAAEDLLDDSTQQYLAFDELRGRLEMLISALPEKSQVVYRLNKEEGKSYKEIAEELDMTEKAVDAHLVRAKRSLRTGLGSFLGSFLL